MGKRSGSNPAAANNHSSNSAATVTVSTRGLRKKSSKHKKHKKDKRAKQRTLRSDADKLLSNFEALCVDIGPRETTEESLSDPGPSTSTSTSSSTKPRRRSKRVRLNKKAESKLCSLLESLSCDTAAKESEEASSSRAAASFLPAIRARDVRIDPRVRARLREELPVEIVPREQLLDKEQRKKQKKVLRKAKKRWKKSRNEDRKRKIELRPSILNV